MILILLATAACASTSAPGRFAKRVVTPNEGVRAELKELQERVLELQRQAAVNEIELRRLRDQLGEDDGSSSLARRSSAASSSSPVAAAESGSAPSVAADLRSRSTPEVTSSDWESRKVVEVEKIDLGDLDDEPIEESPESPNLAPDESSGSSSGTSRGPLSLAGQTLYDQGYTLLHKGQYLEAETSFARFLSSFPASELADNAQYWIGEGRFARGDFRGALAAFREVVNRYPDGNKVADALFKAGQCLEQLGDIQAARQSFEEIIRRHPTSAASIQAEDALGRLD